MHIDATLEGKPVKYDFVDGEVFTYDDYESLQEQDLWDDDKDTDEDFFPWILDPSVLDKYKV